MNQSQLNTFVAVAKYLNFSEAAKELYVSQPTVSHQISGLEQELGTDLFIRTAMGIRLSRCGELFLEDAKDILGKTADAIERVRLAKENPELSLHIAYLLAPSHSFLPGWIREFRELYPQAERP